MLFREKKRENFIDFIYYWSKVFVVSKSYKQYKQIHQVTSQDEWELWGKSIWPIWKSTWITSGKFRTSFIMALLDNLWLWYYAMDDKSFKGKNLWVEIHSYVWKRKWFQELRQAVQGRKKKKPGLVQQANMCLNFSETEKPSEVTVISLPLVGICAKIPSFWIK